MVLLTGITFIRTDLIRKTWKTTTRNYRGFCKMTLLKSIESRPIQTSLESSFKGPSQRCVDRANLRWQLCRNSSSGAPAHFNVMTAVVQPRLKFRDSSASCFTPSFRSLHAVEENFNRKGNVTISLQLLPFRMSPLVLENWRIGASGD